MASQWSDRAHHFRDAAAHKVAQARFMPRREQDTPYPGPDAPDLDGATPALEAGPGETVDELPTELALTDEETTVLALLQYLMIERDVAAVISPSARPKKVEVRNHIADSIVSTVSSTAPEKAWHQKLVSELTDTSAEEERAALASTAPDTAADLRRRVGAMVALVELHMLHPWPKGHPWNATVRRRCLEEIATAVPALTLEDNARVENELRAVLRQLKRKQVSWGRVAVVGVVGLGLGAVTGGLAAPLIGGSIGAASGLSGAAATSAGLAALGGGSLAAGGFGIAGGTAVITGVGAFAGAGAAAGGARATRWAKPGEIAREAIKAAVVTRLITLDQEHDEEKAKRVVMALQFRLDEVTASISRLGDRIRELSEENEQLRRKLEGQRDEAKMAETTLQIAIDRIDVDQDHGGLLEIEKADDDEQDRGNP